MWKRNVICALQSLDAVSKSRAEVAELGRHSDFRNSHKPLIYAR